MIRFEINAQINCYSFEDDNLDDGQLKITTMYFDDGTEDVEAEIDTETKTVTINGNVYDGSTSKTEFDTNPDAPEYLDVVLNDDVFDVQSLSVLYFAKK